MNPIVRLLLKNESVSFLIRFFIRGFFRSCFVRHFWGFISFYDSEENCPLVRCGFQYFYRFGYDIVNRIHEIVKSVVL